MGAGCDRGRERWRTWNPLRAGNDQSERRKHERDLFCGARNVASRSFNVALSEPGQTVVAARLETRTWARRPSGTLGAPGVRL